MQLFTLDGETGAEQDVVEALQSFVSEARDLDAVPILVADDSPAGLSMRFSNKSSKKDFLDIVHGCIESGDDRAVFRYNISAEKGNVMNLNHRGTSMHYNDLRLTRDFIYRFCQEELKADYESYLEDTLESYRDSKKDANRNQFSKWLWGEGRMNDKKDPRNKDYYDRVRNYNEKVSFYRELLYGWRKEIASGASFEELENFGDENYGFDSFLNKYGAYGRASEYMERISEEFNVEGIPLTYSLSEAVEVPVSSGINSWGRDKATATIRELKVLYDAFGGINRQVLGIRVGDKDYMKDHIQYSPKDMYRVRMAILDKVYEVAGSDYSALVSDFMHAPPEDAAKVLLLNALNME
jgi:hypothetical protein